MPDLSDHPITQPLQHVSRKFQLGKTSMSEANKTPTSLAVDEDVSNLAFEVATFAVGCFWNAEETFAPFGSTIVGYTGGVSKQPSHSQVSRGRTGHAEAVRLVFDPATTPYSMLLAAFFSCHDATKRKAKSQYRSSIFFHNDAQKEAALAAVAACSGNVLTELVPAGAFWRADQAHHHYNAKSRLSNVARPLNARVLRSVGKPCCSTVVGSSLGVDNVEVEPERRKACPWKGRCKQQPAHVDATRV